MAEHYDVFNGDADGICALHQLRMAHSPDSSVLITGVKRDIRLLEKIKNLRDCRVTVLDISMAANHDALTLILQNRNQTVYFDHHFAGEIPDSPFLRAYIDPSPDICTSLLVNDYLGGRYLLWAICGAFGDNLHEQALKLAANNDLSQEKIDILQEIGELINYNGYGSTIEDLHFAPDELYRQVHLFQDPFAFYRENKALAILRAGYDSDLAKCLDLNPLFPREKNRIFQLPDESWARRISGIFANLKAREKREAAHALMTKNNDKTWRISVRAPLNNKKNADNLCKSFPTGGGRAAAAGINYLPEEKLEDFFKAFNKTYP
ncbi:MAG: acetyltransferase [Deltaproteobacteria bacterium]|nr:MAG: acetyltransferase [Deltaproteobacteria bacterium]